MGLVRVFSLLSAGLLSFAAESSAGAAPRPASPPATASIRLGRPVTLTWVKNLDFAALRVTSSGTATINPNTGVLTTTGGVLRVAGTPQAAEFEIAASRTALLIIAVPNGPVTLTRIGGTESMTVSNWALDGLGIRIVPQNGVLNVRLGARLNVNTSQADGTYTGQFNVTADYF
jgi:hypothetical protein